jgi:Undecaprenyl-phosphate glucose phosphotransferase
MAQDQLPLAQSLLRKPAGVGRLTRAAVFGSVALTEGIAAGLVMVVAALLYHLAVHDVELGLDRLALYGGFSAVIGLIYAIFSALSASQFLDRRVPSQTLALHGVASWAGAFAGALLCAFIIGTLPDLSRASMIGAFVVGVPLLVIVRQLTYGVLRTELGRGLLPYDRVGLIGLRADLDRIQDGGQLLRDGRHVVHSAAIERLGGRFATLDDEAVGRFATDCRRREVDTVLLVGTLEDLDAVERLMSHLKRYAFNVLFAPSTGNARLKFQDVVALGPNNAMRIASKPINEWGLLAKRIFDLAGAGIGLVLLSPLLIGVAVMIKLDSPGPVFFRQERRGFNGDVFRIWKFRSMRVMESGHKMTQAKVGDSRITRIGRIIRATSIDELPQLLNVISGEMSLVGPRPHAISHDAELSTQLAEYAHRQRIKPGITGWAQVNGFRGDTSTFAQIEGRTIHDLHYIENWSILLDIWIVLLTVFSSKTRQNAV